MCRRLLLLTLTSAALVAGPIRAQEAGYTLHRLVLWSEPGDPYPRFQRDPETGGPSVIFPGPIPEKGWDPVEAPRLVLHGAAFVPAKPLRILRPRDPDPEWDSTATTASLDLNRDGIAEIVSARTVMVPDNRDPTLDHQRVLVELREGDRCLFGDLLEGPGEGPVKLRSISTADITGDGFPDMLVRLESRGRGGLAFYSQAPLRYEGSATRIIPGFSPTAFQAGRYGIFDLARNPRDFLSRLPPGARAADPLCATGSSGGTGKDHRRRCRYFFSSAYLGWIREFRIDFIPNLTILAFELRFPSDGPGLRPEEALEALAPVLGGGYREETEPGEGEGGQLWIWKGKGVTATLTAEKSGGAMRAVSLRLERD